MKEIHFAIKSLREVEFRPAQKGILKGIEVIDYSMDGVNFFVPLESKAGRLLAADLGRLFE